MQSHDSFVSRVPTYCRPHQDCGPFCRPEVSVAMRKAAPALEWQPSEWLRPSIARTALPFILALSACSTEDPSGDGEAPLGSNDAPANSSSASGGLSPSGVPLAPPNPSATSVHPVNTGGPATMQTVPQLAPTSPPSEPTADTDSDSSPANSSGSGSDSDTGEAQSDGDSTAESSRSEEHTS